MEFESVIRTRRSVRRFTEQAVPKEVVAKLVEAASFAPSWKNSQTVRYHAVFDPALKNRIAEEATFTFSKNRLNISGAPVLIVITTIDGISGYEPDGSPTTTKGSHWQSYDAGLATENFVLAAREAGLGSVILGIFNEDKVRELLHLPDGESVSALLPLGYPAEEPNCPKRKSLDELLIVHE
ncbi:MAG: nitroreductase family protein [Oscillospiraceae bacterium]|nr:nitroreductase family protein [Oscillospiraceae bacterium]